MPVSVFDLLTIGIGPSSSHTVGPMRAARMFALALQSSGLLPQVARIKAEMFGSLGATGKGHGTPKAVLLGLEGDKPETVELSGLAERIHTIKMCGRLSLLGSHSIAYSDSDDLLLHRSKSLPLHANGMRFSAYDDTGVSLDQRIYYSIGGGFVNEDGAEVACSTNKNITRMAYPFSTGESLLAFCREHDLSISDVMYCNEQAWRSEAETRSGLLKLWQVMQDCVARGIRQEGQLPGGLKVKRRAKQLHQQLLKPSSVSESDPMAVMDWVTLYALAVNEENAAGGRIVTAPTNGAAGIIPAVLHYYWQFCKGANVEGVCRFLLTAAAIGILYKENASISGAEVGCQGEVGSACSMAAAGLAEVLGGTPEQVENAAEIAMEHNLGLTCDPVGGLVQVPCIERNAIASVKAIHAARMALRGDGGHFVSLDKVIKTMRDTGRDMQDKYKETARGGLALNVVEVPVNIVEC